jgi:hypothetical protein
LVAFPSVIAGLDPAISGDRLECAQICGDFSIAADGRVKPGHD